MRVNIFEVHANCTHSVFMHFIPGLQIENEAKPEKDKTAPQNSVHTVHTVHTVHSVPLKPHMEMISDANSTVHEWGWPETKTLLKQ